MQVVNKPGNNLPRVIKDDPVAYVVEEGAGGLWETQLA